jgi:hypothetical protein
LAQLSALQKQEIFRHRHILESKPGPPNSKFDRQALMKLGALRAEREIQGMYSRSLELIIAENEMVEKSISQREQRFLIDSARLAHCWTYFQDPMANHSEDSMWLRSPWVVPTFRNLPFTGPITTLMPFFILMNCIPAN